MVGSILQSTSSSSCSLLKLPFHLEDLEVSPAAQARSQVHCLGQHRGKTQMANDGWWVQNVDVQLVQPEKWDEMRSRSPTTHQSDGSGRSWELKTIEDCGSHGDVLLTGFTKGFIGGFKHFCSTLFGHVEMLTCDLSFKDEVFLGWYRPWTKIPPEISSNKPSDMF